MNKISRRVIAAAGALALTGGTALAAAAPASAQPTEDNYSYAASSTFSPEVALAQNSFGQHVVHQGSFSVFSHLVSGGNVVDTATNNGASSNVAGVNVRSILGGLVLSARVARSSCDTNGDASTTIIGGTVGVGRFGEPIDTNPSEDEEIDLPGGIEVYLNDQSFDGDFLTVNAMLIELPSGLEITVGTSVCEDDA